MEKFHVVFRVYSCEEEDEYTSRILGAFKSAIDANYVCEELDEVNNDPYISYYCDECVIYKSTDDLLTDKLLEELGPQLVLERKQSRARIKALSKLTDLEKELLDLKNFNPYKPTPIINRCAECEDELN